MKRGHSTKKIGFQCSCFWTLISPSGLSQEHKMPYPITAHTAADPASNGTSRSHRTAPHRKNAALRSRSDSPYQQRGTLRDNPTQLLIKQAVEHLIRQLEAGKSEALTEYLSAMARFHSYSFG